jgi:hypothetical protein
VVFRSFLGAGSPLFSWLFPCWCHPKALSPGVSSPPILSVRATPSCAQVSAFPSHNFDLSSSAASVCRSRIIWARRQGVRAQVSVRSCRGSVQSSLGSARSLSDHVGSLSDRHLAQPGLCPIVSGLYPIIIWLSLVSVRSCRVSVRSCRVSVRSSFGSAWSLSDRHFALPLYSCGVSLARFIL